MKKLQSSWLTVVLAFLLVASLYLVGKALGNYYNKGEVVENTTTPSHREYTLEEMNKVYTLLEKYREDMHNSDLSFNLMNNNNPYGIMEEDSLLSFEDERDADTMAYKLIKERIGDYDIYNDNFVIIFKEIFGDTMYYTNISNFDSYYL